MKSHGIIIALFCSISSILSLGQNAWERVTPLPQEHTINDICKIPGTDKVIAVGDGATIMISDDIGETWQLLLNPGGLENNFNLKTVYFYNSEIGYVGGRTWVNNTFQYDYILKTIDGGENWILYDDFPGMESYIFYDFYFVDENIGFAVSYEAILKTTDGGENWVEVETGASFNFYAIDFCSDSTGFIVGTSSSKVLKTNDFGNSWTEVDFISPISNGDIGQIQFINNTSGFTVLNGDILKTTNAGESWEVFFSDTDISIYVIDFFDENHGIATGYQNYMQSCIVNTNNGGVNWNINTLPVFQENSYAVCMANPTHSLFFGNQGMIYKSGNSGETWSQISERVFFGDIIQVQHLNDNTIFYLTLNDLYSLDQNIGLYKTLDGGLSFTQIADFIIYPNNVYTGAAFHFLNDNLGYITYHDYDNLLTVLKTDNGGNTWSELESGNLDDRPHAIRFYDEQNGLITTSFGNILKTSNGGDLWQVVYDGMYTYGLMDIYYFSDSHIVATGMKYWSSAMSVIVESYDGGETWEEMILGEYGTVFDIEVINNYIYLACEYNVILKSPDGGETWQYSFVNSPNDIEFHSIHFPSENIGYAVGKGSFETMVKTTDGGDTWIPMQSGSTSGLNAVYFMDENNGFVYGENGVVLETSIGGTVNLEERQFEKTKNYFSAFPNPFNKSFTIEFNLQANALAGIFEIFTPNGEKILSRQVSDLKGKIEFPADFLRPGIYITVFHTKSGISETQKIIKL